MQRTYYAPASIGNLSVGFDTLGLALAPCNGELLGDLLSLQVAERTTLSIQGSYQHQLPPASADNLVLKCWQAFRVQVTQQLPELAFTLTKNLPVGSGLGSSACSIVVACYALNHFFDQPLSRSELLHLTATLEGGASGSVHYDNVAPSLYGGLQLMVPDRQQPCRSLPWFEHWQVVVSYPGTVIHTADARRVLPQQVPLATAIKAAGNLAGFVTGLQQQDEQLALNCLQDCLAEPHRLQLMPELTELRQQAEQLGVAHLGISGAGPTVFALCRTAQQAEQMQQLLTRSYHKNADAMTHCCRIDQHGARALDLAINP